MPLQHFGKGVLRVAKNYTKRYSDTQAKVRDATSNDPWGPSGTQMNEIAKLTYNQNDFVEIMEMLDKRLNDKGKNWRHVFKSLTVLDFLLHAGSENVTLYFRDNLYVIKTLKEFQYVDEDGKDKGANIRQKAKEASNLLSDPAHLQEERRVRAGMRDRIISGNNRGRNRSVDPDEEEPRNTIEAPRKALIEEQSGKSKEIDLAAAIRLSEEEKAKRHKAVKAATLFDDQAQINNPFPFTDPATYATGLQPQQTFQPQFTMQPQLASFNPYREQAQQEAMKDYVGLGKMNIDEADRWPLLESTTGALSEEALQTLLLSSQQTNLELSIMEDNDEDVAFVDASPSATRLSSPTSGVQNVASVALPSHHQRQERHDAPPSSIQVQAELDINVLIQDLTKYITKVDDYPTTRGGFGEIWRCTYSASQGPVPVAVKSLLVYASDQLTEKKTQRIQRELRICAGLKHPNVLPVYGYTLGFGPFMAIVCPWAENGNLTAYMGREDTASLTFVRRFQILRDITEGLKYLHANNVIHGDLTGPNVLIHADGTACLADFGLSLLYSEVVSVTQASWTSSLHGNFRWLAPELLEPSENNMPVRPRKHSDVYSFGGIMLQVLTNQSPYYYYSNEAAVIRCIYTGEKPNRSRYAALSDKYWDFIEECWSTATHDRPSTDKVVQVISDEFDSLSSFADSS